MASARWIIHVDLDAFYASVEELLNPALRGKAVIVGGDPRRRGVVSSASYEARRYGVRSAMPVARALRLCPHAVVVPARHGIYSERSRAVMEILHDFTPVVEQLSIDEAFLDVTGCERLWGPIEEIARSIQQRVNEEENLPVSLGAASSKLVAKIACDEGKPKGIVIVPQDQEAEYLAPLAIEKLWGVGEVTGRRLRDLGIETIGDLARRDEEELARRLGETGRHLYRHAHGLDDRPVHTSRERRSISQEQTFARDVDDAERIERILLGMSEHVAAKLRDRNWVAQTIRIKFRYPDFDTHTRQTTLEQPTDQAQVIYQEALDLLHRHWNRARRLRLVGVGVSGLLEQSGYQLSLFERKDQKRIRLNQALDEIRDRFGDGSITRASLIRRRRRDKERDKDA